MSKSFSVKIHPSFGHISFSAFAFVLCTAIYRILMAQWHKLQNDGVGRVIGWAVTYILYSIIG